VLPELSITADVACEYCGDRAELESDGESEYYVCSNCGGTFGFRGLRQDQGACGLGVPVALQQPAPPGQVFLGIPRRPQ